MTLMDCIMGLNLNGFSVFSCLSLRLLSGGFLTGRIVDGYSASSAGYMGQKKHIAKKKSHLDMMEQYLASDGTVTIGDTGSTLAILNQLRINYALTSVFQYLLISEISNWLRHFQ